MGPLVVANVQFLAKENASAHNTEKYELLRQPEPTIAIVRRGQPFKGLIEFTGPFNEVNDVVQLVFTIGDQPTMETQGIAVLRRDVMLDIHTWSANIVEVEDNTVTFLVSTPVTIPVGVWSVEVVTSQKSSPARRQKYTFKHDVYILFNPWNADDQTYMKDASLLQEYVLNDIGKIWLGPVNTSRGKAWSYAQFDALVLPACMLILKKADFPFNLRGDPIKLTRVISKMVNSNDYDGGVVTGRWDGKYEDGTAPMDWTCSGEILQQFVETQRPVSYGQCWVFAGVVNTVCRALGIPSRVVSNLVSAHDTDTSLSVDQYYDENMEESLHTRDSVWNYHVWNDVWMARPDLPSGYGGWQAIDATPQEQSQGIYQCGPASLEAIKNGNIGLSFDVAFLLSEVNADYMRWRKDPEAENGYSVVDTNKYHIGRMVLTKKPFVFDPIGDQDREDITCQYKYQENTPSERLALMNGVRHSERAKRYYSVVESLEKEVIFELNDIDTVQIGQDFQVSVNVKNVTDKDRNVCVSLRATSIYYTGVKAEIIKRVDGKVLVKGQQSRTVSLTVKVNDYLPKLVEQGNIKISAMAIVDETKQSWADDDDFQIIKPNIEIKITEALIKGKKSTVELSFKNPLDRKLTGCEFRVTAAGLAARTLVLPAANVHPEGRAITHLRVKPNRLGKVNLIATFKSKELKDVHGAATAEILEE